GSGLKLYLLLILARGHILGDPLDRGFVDAQLLQLLLDLLEPGFLLGVLGILGLELLLVRIRLVVHLGASVDADLHAAEPLQLGDIIEELLVLLGIAGRRRRAAAAALRRILLGLLE